MGIVNWNPRCVLKLIILKSNNFAIGNEENLDYYFVHDSHDRYHDCTK
jgi:hypothetical protein